MRHLAQRADALQQVYPTAAETQAIVGVTILVTSLAMNHVHRGSYFPEAPPAKRRQATEQPPSPSQGTAAEASRGPATATRAAEQSDAQRRHRTAERPRPASCRHRRREPQSWRALRACARALLAFALRAIAMLPALERQLGDAVDQVRIVDAVRAAAAMANSLSFSR